MPKFQKHTHNSGTGDRAVSGDISNGQLDHAEIAELFQRLADRSWLKRHYFFNRRGIVSFTLMRAVRHGAVSVRTLAAAPRNAPHRPARGTRHRYAGWPRQRFPCAAG